eukprot:6466646-Amphidinium_carterae.1
MENWSSEKFKSTPSDSKKELMQNVGKPFPPIIQDFFTASLAGRLNDRRGNFAASSIFKATADGSQCTFHN